MWSIIAPAILIFKSKKKQSCMKIAHITYYFLGILLNRDTIESLYKNNRVAITKNINEWPMMAMKRSKFLQSNPRWSLQLVFSLWVEWGEGFDEKQSRKICYLRRWKSFFSHQYIFSLRSTLCRSNKRNNMQILENGVKERKIGKLVCHQIDVQLGRCMVLETNDFFFFPNNT